MCCSVLASRLQTPESWSSSTCVCWTGRSEALWQSTLACAWVRTCTCQTGYLPHSVQSAKTSKPCAGPDYAATSLKNWADIDFEPLHGWAAAETSTDPHGRGVLGIDFDSNEPGGTLGIAHPEQDHFTCRNMITSLKEAAAWHPRRSTFAAFGPSGPTGARRVMLFDAQARVRLFPRQSHVHSAAVHRLQASGPAC